MRYELAKKQGLNWQVVLIQDTETDIKTTIMKSIIDNEPFSATNRRVNELIDKCIKELESEKLKQITRPALSNYATKMYVELLQIFGNQEQGLLLLATMRQLKIEPTPQISQRLNTLPTASQQTRTQPQEVYSSARIMATPNMGYDLEYEKSVLSRVLQIIDSTAKEDYSERYSLRATAERQIREEWHEKQLADLKEKGVKFTWISEHANCSERCKPWQGRLYSLDHTTGSIGGINYVPLENATDIYVTTKNGKVWKNGCISGFNCRHSLIPYRKGFTPVKIKSEVIEHEREINTKQRELERNVRQYETRALTFKQAPNTLFSFNGQLVSGKNLYQHYKKLAQKWTSEYIDYSRKNQVAYYPSRLDI